MTIRAIVTDIEGTTSSISFVHEVLFPYASANLEKFVKVNADEPFITQIIHQVINFGIVDDRHCEEAEPTWQSSPCSAPMQELSEAEIKHAFDILQHWIKLDLKIKPLKDLQGLIWEEGYKNGDFKGHIYEDAYLKLKEWHDQGIPLYIYSSGSVHAQKLLFGHTEYGDLNDLFSGNFDTKIGGKKESESYSKIATVIASDNEAISPIQTSEILFLSDIEAELDAAAEVGMKTTQLVRPGTTPSERHIKVDSFNAIII